MSKSNVNSQFWQGKKVLVTGHSGFKGSWLTYWLHRMGAEVCGVSLPMASSPNLFELLNLDKICRSVYCDIRDQYALTSHLTSFNPDIVFHLAAQALVRTSYLNPLDTFSTNVIGTANLLNSIRESLNTKVAVFVTTDKVYRNDEGYWPYRETDPLGGHDPYSSSKAASELVIDCFRNSFLKDKGLAIASARAGNVMGGGDWAIDRLLPDAIRAWEQNKPLYIRRPDSVRPWQHVLDPLASYLILAQQLWSNSELAGSYNFGPISDQSSSVRTVVDLALQAYGKGEVIYTEDFQGPHEAGLLRLDVSKATSLLGISGGTPLKLSISKTINWYRMQQSGYDATELCENDIVNFESFT